MLTISSTKLALLIGLVSVTSQVHALERGVAWATDNRWATAFTNTSITWYHHWQDPTVTQMASNIQYVPMNWGPKYNSLWYKREAQMNASLPQYLLSYNEPDVPSQANMTPNDAITGHMQNMTQWRAQGVLVSSPQIVWNTTWLTAFMNGIQSQGSDVDFMAIHYYGSWNDTASPKKYIQKVYKLYGKPIWITEIGTTQSSNGTDQNHIDFMNTMLAWMETQSYIQRVVWSGAWSVATPPDNYIAVGDGMFNPNATLRDIGLQYARIAAPAPTTTISTVVATSTSSSSTTSSTSVIKSTSTSTVSISSSSSTSIKTTSSVPTTTTTPAPTTAKTTSSSAKPVTTTTTHIVTPTSTAHSSTSTVKVPASTLVKSTSSSTKRATTTSSSKKATSTSKKTTSSTKKTTSSTKKHTSTSTKKHTSTSTKHHTSTSTKHATSTSTKHTTSTSTKKAAASTAAQSKCRVLVNKGNVVRSWVDRDQVQEE